MTSTPQEVAQESAATTTPRGTARGLAARRHLWKHFTRESAYGEGHEIPIIVRGEGAYVYDDRGRRYLDGLAGLFVKAAEAVTPVFAQTAADGALPVLYAATAPEAEPGGYYGPGGPLELRGASPRPARAATFTGDKAAQDRLWAQSEALTGVAFG